MSREAPFHCNVEEWKRRFGDLPVRTAVTIGNFDGLHLGHQKILETVKNWVASKESLCKKPEQLISTVLTFYPHPAKVLRPAEAPLLLYTLQQRLAAFESAGMHAALVLKFDEQLAKVSAEDFARMYLVEILRVACRVRWREFSLRSQAGWRRETARRVWPALGF